MEIQAPTIAKTVLKKCGRISFAKKTTNNIRKCDFRKPDQVRRQAALMITQVGTGREKDERIVEMTSEMNNLNHSF